MALISGLAVGGVWWPLVRRQANKWVPHVAHGDQSAHRVPRVKGRKGGWRGPQRSEDTGPLGGHRAAMRTLDARCTMN